jgi:phosphoribosylformylglycinamidine synthase
LEQVWAAASHHMARHRDHPESVDQEHALIVAANPGMQPEVDFEHTDVLLAPYVNTRKPKMAILREQGVNGQNEMAMAFMRAGFDCYDVHMQDLIDGRFALQDFNGLAACGGFSYGDVLGAGQGWAKSIIYNDALKASFSQFFADTNKFALGVCNGCQMLSALRSIIPGTDQWPDFVRNRSEQFEARYSQLRIADSNNLFFTGMAGALIPVAIAHGEGRAAFASNESAETVLAAQYADNQGQPTQLYPMNPNGSTSAVAAVTNEAGNVLAMMPHPERVFRTVQMSWAPEHWGEDSPWMRMFYNARLFVN